MTKKGAHKNIESLRKKTKKSESSLEIPSK
jgi:hypothetical protein